VDSKKPWALVMTSQEFSSQLLLHERNLFKEVEPDYYIYLLEDTQLMDEEYGKFTLYKPIRIILSYISWFHQVDIISICIYTHIYVYMYRYTKILFIFYWL